MQINVRFINVTAKRVTPSAVKLPVKGSLELIQVFQPRKHNLFACFLDFAREKHLIENRIYLHSPPVSTMVVPTYLPQPSMSLNINPLSRPRAPCKS